MQAQDFQTLLTATRSIAQEVASVHAADVDARSRFPHEAVAAMRSAKLMSAGVPASLGGFGCSLGQQAALCAAIGQGCSASGMILAMHLIEVACMARHGMGSAWFRGELEALVGAQTLIA